ncbi:zinc-binding dehydrogenase [Mycolicibacterium baixiangningiae]|uniref:zinc-binding dehydrogenase n=1 Tax=Mycolicibacterium baixiangningiae TaxID=2761578 RepID=UPI00186676A3|nr:zinc-binding dehydrogenase [Mycolicibacterium baixiangningiae]
MSTGTMRAAVLTRAGGPDVLTLDRVLTPIPAAGEVLVRVCAFGLNNAEVLQRRGAMPPPDSGIPGLECSGVVAATGPGVTGWKPGDRVAALARCGTYAEYVAVPGGACMRVPDGLDLAVAAAAPEAAATAWWNLVCRGRIRAGERVLIHGAAGGVGSLAVQLARRLGAYVVGTARGDQKTALCAGLGCHEVIDYGSVDVFDTVSENFDVILDNQGGPAIAANVSVLAPFGRLIIVGVQAGGPGRLDAAVLMARAAEVSSSSLGRLDDVVREQICREVEQQVLPRLADGAIRVVVDRRFAFEDIVGAHERFSAPDRVGKVLVTVTDDI